jgi:hypothetical protein
MFFSLFSIVWRQSVAESCWSLGTCGAPFTTLTSWELYNWKACICYLLIWASHINLGLLHNLKKSVSTMELTYRWVNLGTPVPVLYFGFPVKSTYFSTNFNLLFNNCPVSAADWPVTATTRSGKNNDLSMPRTKGRETLMTWIEWLHTSYYTIMLRHKGDQMYFSTLL